MNISLIENYSYCPEQAKNQLGNVSIYNTRMRDGSDYHEAKANVRSAFWNSIRAGKKAKPKYDTVKYMLDNDINTDNPHKFSEVFVISDKYEIKGLIDELHIGNGQVVLIDYKTTFNPNPKEFYVSSAVNQMRAYAKSFSEYFHYTGKIVIAIRRVHLSFDNATNFLIKPDEIVEIGENNFMITDGWEGTIHDVYDTIFHSDTDMAEVINIVRQIKQNKFSHSQNPNKCNKCQYNLSCGSSLIGKYREQ